MSISSEQFLQNNALDLLSASSGWVLVRHQWLIDNMRCILTGENAPSLEAISDFDSILQKNKPLPESLMRCFTEVNHQLENLWLATIKASHPMSGLTIFEQLNQYQMAAHDFMEASKEANQKLWQAFAMRDPLTGALNRHTLSQVLTEVILTARQNQTRCSIALLDQDHFKTINDRWGHVVGDMVLTQTADIIRQHLNQNDKLFRYGGDEWLIVLSNTHNVAAQERLAHIQMICASHPFYANENQVFHTSFSFGIAELTDNSTFTQWIMDADLQLYAKKLCNHQLAEDIMPI